MSTDCEPSKPTPKSPQEAQGAFTRRHFMLSGAGAAGWLAVSGPAASKAGDSMTPASASASGAVSPTAAPRSVSLRINGRPHEFMLEPRVTLLDALREHAGLMGTKKGCDRGQCGACTVLVDGQRVNACLTLAVMQQGREVMTIEGLGQPDHLHPVQQNFLDHDAFQCGYCTPGQICSAVALLSEARAGFASAVTADLSAPVTLTEDEIRERMSGNLCRCGAYVNIVQAVQASAGVAPAHST